MHYLEEQGELLCKAGENDISYLLNREELFFPMEFKILEARQVGGLLGCVRMTWNGRPKLVYLTGALRRFDRALPSMTAKEFRQAMGSLMGMIGQIKSGSLLKCANLELSEDRMFLDGEKGTLRLIYLPVAYEEGRFTDAEADSELRQRILRWMELLLASERRELDDLREKLSGSRLDLADIFKVPDAAPEESVEKEPERTSCICSLHTIYEGTEHELEITGESYILGRSLQSDGILNFSPRVSRKHCRIRQEGSEYFVQDLESRNGTVLNGEPVLTGREYRLSDGDTLELADISFHVKIEEQTAKEGEGVL